MIINIGVKNNGLILLVLAQCLVLHGPSPVNHRDQWVHPFTCPPSVPVPASMAGDHTLMLFKAHTGHHYPPKILLLAMPSTKLCNLIPGVSDSVGSLTACQLPELKRLDSPGGKSILESGPLGRRMELIMMAP